MLFSKKCLDPVQKYLLFMGDIVQYIHQKEKKSHNRIVKRRKMFGSIIAIIFCWYCLYRLSKKRYEKTYNKKLKFRDTLNPKNWDKLY